MDEPQTHDKPANPKPIHPKRRVAPSSPKPGDLPPPRGAGRGAEDAAAAGGAAQVPGGPGVHAVPTSRAAGGQAVDRTHGSFGSRLVSTFVFFFFLVFRVVLWFLVFFVVFGVFRGFWCFSWKNRGRFLVDLVVADHLPGKPRAIS